MVTIQVSIFNLQCSPSGTLSVRYVRLWGMHHGAPLSTCVQHLCYLFGRRRCTIGSPHVSGRGSQTSNPGQRAKPSCIPIEATQHCATVCSQQRVLPISLRNGPWSVARHNALSLHDASLISGRLPHNRILLKRFQRANCPAHRRQRFKTASQHCFIQVVGDNSLLYQARLTSRSLLLMDVCVYPSAT